MKRRHDDEDTDAWLITYADMVTLLLCFFIIMFAISTPDGEMIKKVSEALKKQGFYDDQGVINDPYTLENIRKDLSLALGSSGYDQFVAISEQDDAVSMELASSSFFEKGSAKFSKQGVTMLNVIVEKLKPLATKDILVEVEGHTDDTPIATAQFPSNWELSASRATNVVRYLVAKGFPTSKLKAVGMGDGYPKAPNRDSTGTPIPANQELNRRVVVVIHKVQ